VKRRDIADSTRLAGNQINLSYAKLTNKEEEIMHILWKLSKSVRKRSDGKLKTSHYTTTIVRNLEEKRIRCP
jgi:hypothetical protein